MEQSKKRFLENRHKLLMPTVKSRMKLYDRLCEICDFLLAKYNPCQFGDDGCAGYATASCGCCIGCEFLGDKKCNTKALQCKVYLCYDVRNPHLMEQFGRIMSIGSINRLIHYRNCREFVEGFLIGIGIPHEVKFRYYCEECRSKVGWPKGIALKDQVCELCKHEQPCHMARAGEVPKNEYDMNPIIACPDPCPEDSCVDFSQRLD